MGKINTYASILFKAINKRRRKLFDIFMVGIPVKAKKLQYTRIMPPYELLLTLQGRYSPG